MKKNPRLVEETKNTNYKMHKSKKGWLVSYSLLTFMLGGIYLGSSASTPVKAAEVESQNDQKGVDQELQKSIDSKSVDDAKQNALTTIDTTATTAKAKINADQNLSSSAKSTQLKNVDAIVADAKDKVNKAEDLPAIKAILDDANISITNSYKPGTITASKKKTSAKKEPVVDMSKKPATNKKVGVSTYKGLSSFFRTSSDTAGITATSDKTSTTKTVKSEDTSSLVAGNQTGKTEASKLAPRAASTDSVTGQTTANTTADKKDTNQYTSQAEATPRVDTAADTTGDNSVTVGSDQDSDRLAFQDQVNRGTTNTPTSVNVPTPDQILNPDKYKQKVANVSTLAQLAAAWQDTTVTYINITADIADDGSTFNARVGKSIVVNGNGHTIDLGAATSVAKAKSFYITGVGSTNPTTVTITNATFKSGTTNNNATYNSLVFTDGGLATDAAGGLTINIDNINLGSNQPVKNSNGPAHVAYAPSAAIRFSGENNFELSNEATRSVTNIEFANNASVKMDRLPGTGAGFVYSEFYITHMAKAGTTGYGNKLTMGDGSSNYASTYQGVAADFPAWYSNVNQAKVGDNVTWTQKGFEYFIDATKGNHDDSVYEFGENFTLNAPITVQSGVIQLTGNQKATFAAGTKFDVNQASRGAIISVAGKSSVTFTSPKTLHLAIIDSNGKPVSGTQGIFNGTGTVSLNDSKISTWDGVNSDDNSGTNADHTEVFSSMSVTNGVATLQNLNGETVTSSIVSKNTRELNTLAISVGTMDVQYVDQNNKVLKTVQVPLDDATNYIGQSIPFISKKYVNDNMPENYMWALGKQVYSGAKKDPNNKTIDSYGQAIIGIVPMVNTHRTYTIYVYGAPQKVQYQYVDINHKDRGALATNLSGQTGNEGSNGKLLQSANYANTVDWTDSYYTKDNVPAGYHYYVEATGQGVQPKSTLVGTENPLVTIYVEGNQQTITPTYVNKDGIAVQPIQPITVSSKTGDVTEIPKAPDVKNYAFDHVEVNGKEVPAGSTFIMANGTDSIKYVYHSLKQEKDTAINNINSHADDAITAVNGNVNLTTDEKTKQKDAINAARNEAIDKINKAELQSEVDKAYQDGIAKIDAAHNDKGKALADQKTDAIKDLQEAAATAKDVIAKDETLTAAEKDEQTKAVDQALATATDNVNNAPDADAVNKAKADGIAAINAIHQSGKSLAGQKADAIKALQEAAATAKDVIAKDETLTAAEKDEQTKAVDQALATATDNVNNAPDADAVNKAKDDGIAAINAIHQSGKSLAGQKADAIKALQKAATDAKDAIAKDATLTAAEKDEQTKAVDQALATATDNVNNAPDADAVNKAKDDGIAAINAIHQSNKAGITGLQDAAKQKLDQIAQRVKNEIDGDPTLTTAEKTNQKGDVDKALAEGNANIDKATTADDINAAFNAGEAAIEAAHQSNKAGITGLQDAAKQRLEQIAQRVKNEIDGDPTLTTAEKTNQKGDVDKALAEGNANIDKATTADDINAAFNAGEAAIEAAHQSNKAGITGLQDAAKQRLEQIAQRVKNEIDGDPTLTTAEKTNQKGDVDKALAEGNANIDKATTADDINAAFNAGEAAIEAAHQSNKLSLQQQKDNSKSDIDKVAQEVKNEIDGDPTLTNAEKASQKAKVDADAQKAKAAIDNATDAQGVVDAHDAGVDQIRKDHQPNTTTLEEQKQNAKDAIDAEAVKIKDEIEKDPTLTNAEKTAQKNKVDRDAAAAKDNIDAATNAQGIVDERDQGKKVIDGDHVTSDTPLSDQKQNAKDAIDNEAIKIKGEIDADPTLTSAEKAEQKAKVDADAQTAKDNIDDATDAQGVKDAQRAGIKAIDKDHVSGTSLDDQKQAAKAKIDKEAKDTKSLINSDPTLTDAEKTAQKAKVDADAVAAKDAIDKATTAQGVIGVTNDGINTIDADYQPSDATLDQQRQAAKDRIDEEADKIKGWINKDPSLDSKAKADQIAAVDAAATAAKNKIDAATNAQGIKAARDKGIIDIDSKYLTNPMSLVDQKKYAQQLIRDEAEIVKEEINSDPVLDDQTKKDQIAAVEAQMQKAIDKIEAAATAQQVQEEYTNGVNVLHAQHLSGNDLATQKQSAKDALVQEANTIKAIIAADTALDDDEKATQTANVEGELEKAENAVDRAKNSQEISDREVAGINAIDAQYVPGKTLDDQKTEANKAIDEAATAAKASIDAAKNLTNPEKAKAKQAVDDAANAAKDNVDAATDSEGIEKAQTDGIDAINAVVKDSSAVELTAVKENAKKAIDAEAAAINQAITNDQNLTPSEKARQSSNVQLEAQKAKNAIDRAEDAQEVKDKENAGIDAIDAQYIPGKPLDQQKADASSEIDAAAANAKDAIDKDTGKTAAEKAKEKQAVDDAAATAKDAINKAENAGDVNKAKEDGLAGIAAAKKPNITLDDQKAAAKDAIDKAANDAKNKISQDLELTPDDKKAANKAIDDAAAAAKDKVDQATNADQVSQVVADVTNEIGKVVSGTDDTKNKNTAKDSIKDHGDSAKKDVDALPNLSDADKQAIKDKIDQAIAAGNANVDAAKTISEMIQAATDAMATIDSIVKDNSGSGSNGSGSNGSDSNGSDSNSSGSNGSESNGSDSNGSESNGSGSNGSDSNGSGSNGSESNGSESNGSGSNGSGSNGSGSNGSDSNGSGSNGSDSNGSESNGSGSNGSDSNGSESNGSGSNGSDSNGSGSNGSGSNGSDSNGSGSNDSESNGSDSNGSGSNGSSSNGSDSNGSESNGSGSNGSDSNGSGSNGSGSNGSDSNGSGSNGSESNGSGSNGSGSNGSDSNGSGSNDSESNGSGSNGSESNGSDSNGSGSNGSESNGSDSNGSESNGSGSNGSDSNGSSSNGSESNGSGSNGSDSNGSDSNGSSSNGSESNGSGSNGSDSNGSGSNGSDSNGSESNGSDSNGS
ncbi:DUF1542 domain-containing protein, partial [Lactobacillus sp. ESL0263]|uniref:DUF1542 domain-containing protein n=1 Tax=Lactobacillus sp. ESL0263 TaxID=2069350 RepID=UPI000EFDA544